MSTNLATILVGLGYDLSALEKGAPEAFRLINQQTLGMSAEMKRASREGAESWRLIDEALGIHLSRPLTRIVTQEFPALANALQSVLGAGVVGALAVAGVDLFEKMARGIEKAQKAQEEFANATRKADETFKDIMASFEKSEKLHSLRGLDKKLFEIDSSVAEETRKKIDELTKALEENAKAAAAAGGWFTKFKAAVGDAAHQVFTSSGALNAEKVDAQLEQFKRRFDDIARDNGLKKAGEELNAELSKADQHLNDLQAQARKTNEFLATHGGVRDVEQTKLFPIITDQEVAAQQRYVDALKEFQQIGAAAGREQASKEGEARTESAKKAIHDAQEEMKRWNEENNKAFEAWLKLNAEIDKATAKLSEASLSESAKRFKEFGLGNQVAPPSGAPLRSDQLELLKLQGSSIDAQNESWKKAGEILNQIETPRQKYEAGLAILNELETKGRLTAEQLALAHQLLDQQWLQSQTHLQRLQTELEKFLQRSKDATDGVKAFFLAMQIDASSDAHFTFEILNQGLKGFEDETAKALTGAKTNWMQYFESLDQMALKFMLNKELTQLFQSLSGTGLGKSLGLDKLFVGQDAAAAKQMLAGTTMMTAAATQLAAANIMASFGGCGGDGGAFVGAIPFFAGGTDNAPGGWAMVGEQGPELVNLPGGSSVTPNSSLRAGGGHTVHIHIDARGGEIGVEEKIARAISESAPQIVMRAVVEASETQRRSLH